jgi:hypothetical protein
VSCHGEGNPCEIYAIRGAFSAHKIPRYGYRPPPDAATLPLSDASAAP